MADDLTKKSTALADVLSTYERTRVELFRRFLAHMMGPDIAPRAAESGYTAKEHEEAWAKLDIVDGRQLTFDDALTVARRDELINASPLLKSRLRYLDEIENRWFERFRDAIPRFIGSDDLGAFVAAFWQDLQQQPEGPGVLNSVSKLCDRHESLATNQTPGAKELHASMDRRGFNAEMLEDIRNRIEICRKELPKEPAPLPNQAKLTKVAGERREAFRWLNAFYNDWATTLRTELTYHQAVRLGITAVKGGRQAGEEPSDPTPDDTK